MLVKYRSLKSIYTILAQVRWHAMLEQTLTENNTSSSIKLDVHIVRLKSKFQRQKTATMYVGLQQQNKS